MVDHHYPNTICSRPRSFGRRPFDQEDFASVGILAETLERREPELPVAGPGAKFSSAPFDASVLNAVPISFSFEDEPRLIVNDLRSPCRPAETYLLDNGLGDAEGVVEQGYGF